MKTKTTMKDIVNRYDKVFRCGYCDVQAIFRYSEPIYYNAGLYGWNCDIYVEWVNGNSIAITTGYRNMRGRRIPSDILSNFQQRASIITDNYSLDFNTKSRELEVLQKAFLVALDNL